MSAIIHYKNDKIFELLTSYYMFLLKSDIYSDKSIDYVFDLADLLNVSNKYFENFIFDENTFPNGAYIRESRTILINLKKLMIAKDLKLIDTETLIIEYLITLLHEFNHAAQHEYCYNNDDEISSILFESFKLKKNSSFNVKSIFHNLYPDEFDSNLRSNLMIYNLLKKIRVNDKLLLQEKNLVRFLCSGVINDDFVINSHLKFLNKILLNRDYKEKFSELNEIQRIYYGVTKGENTMKKIIKSYHIHRMCIDINERR